MSRKERKTISKDLFNLISHLHKNENKKIGDIAESLHLDRKTVRNQIKKIDEGVEFISPYKKRKNTFDEKNRFLTDIENTIITTIALNNATTQKEVQQIIETKHNSTISKSTICRKFEKLNLTRKRLVLIPYERNTNERIEARAEFAAHISRYHDRNLLYLDETGFNEHSRRYYGYSEANEPAYIRTPGNKGVNKSVMVAIDYKGIVAYERQNQAFNKDSFKAFIQNKLCSYFMQNPNTILIMDNASFHKSNNIQQFLHDKRIVFKFLVPYSPQLNPIEEFFSMIKSKISTLRHNNANMNLIDAIDQVLNLNNDYSDSISGFYRNMRNWLEKARRYEPFI